MHGTKAERSVCEELDGISKPSRSLAPLYCCCPFSIFLLVRREIPGTERKKRKTQCVAYRLSEILLLPLFSCCPSIALGWLRKKLLLLPRHTQNGLESIRRMSVSCNVGSGERGLPFWKMFNAGYIYSFPAIPRYPIFIQFHLDLNIFLSSDLLFLWGCWCLGSAAHNDGDHSPAAHCWVLTDV